MSIRDAIFARARSVCAFSMHAEQVKKEGDLAGTIVRAMVSRPALIDVVVSPEVRPSDAKTGLAWIPDLPPLAA